MRRINVATSEFNTVSPNSEGLGPYGIGVFFNSSESRALTYSKLLPEQSISFAMLVDFDGKNNENKKTNLLHNELSLQRIANRYERLDIDDIFNYQTNLNQIAFKINEFLVKTDNRSVFLDITGVPLIYSVALLKFLFRLFPTPDISILNVSGRYKERGAEQFSEGEQYDMYIPGYFGSPDHSLPKHYVFLLGYDGERSLNIFLDNLPEKASVIIPSPGYDVDNDKNTINNNKEFLMEIGYSPTVQKKNSNVFRIDISDVVAVKEKIETLFEENNGKYEIRLVPLGPKPHAIGAALAAMYNNNISIMYQVPRKYYMSEVPAGDKMWLYDFKVED